MSWAADDLSSELHVCGSAGQAGAHDRPEEEQSDGHIQQHVDWTSLHDEEVSILLTSAAEVFKL